MSNILQSISVVVISYNDIDRLKRCIQSIIEISNNHIHQLIIVEDGSIDRLSRIDKTNINQKVKDQYRVKYVYIPRSPKSGRANARNIGASYATHEYIVFIDGDVIVDQNLFKNYKQYFNDNPTEVCVLGKHKTLIDPTWSMDCFPDLRDQIIPNLPVSFKDLFTKWVFFWSNNFCIKRTIFNDVNGMNSHLFTGWGVEDIHFGYKLLYKGYTFDLIDNYVYVECNEYDVIKHYQAHSNYYKFCMFYSDPILLDYFALHSTLHDIDDHNSVMFKDIKQWSDAYLAFELRSKFYNQIKTSQLLISHSVNKVLQYE